MNQQKIDLVDTDEWQAMYVNGKKVAEAVKDDYIDGLEVTEILRALGISYESYCPKDQPSKEYFADLEL